MGIVRGRLAFRPVSPFQAAEEATLVALVADSRAEGFRLNQDGIAVAIGAGGLSASLRLSRPEGGRALGAFVARGSTAAAQPVGGDSQRRSARATASSIQKGDH